MAETTRKTTEPAAGEAPKTSGDVVRSGDPDAATQRKIERANKAAEEQAQRIRSGKAGEDD